MAWRTRARRAATRAALGVLTGAVLLLPMGAALLPRAAAAQASGIANITFQWTDRLGNTHEMKRTFARGWEDDGSLGTEFAGSGFTPGTGTLSFIEDDLGLGQTETEFFGFVDAITGTGNTAHLRGRSALGAAEYSLRWPPTGFNVVVDPPGTSAFTFTAGNDTVEGKTLNMLQYGQFMRDYYKNVHGANIPTTKIVFTNATDGSYYCRGNLGTAECPEQHIQIDANHWASPEVVLHELGHHIGHSNNLQGIFGGPHSFGQDNIGSNNGGRNNGAAGSRLAWGEGLGTWLGLMAVDDGNLAGQYATALPGFDTDLVYHARETPTADETSGSGDLVFRIGTEGNNLNVGAVNGLPQGEGDELAVLRVLRDLYDANVDGYASGFSDNVALGAARLWALFGGKQHFHEFWRDAADDITADPTLIGLNAGDDSDLVLATLGATTQEYGISPVLESVADGVGQRPNIFFREQNNDNSSQYRLLIFDDNWAEVERVTAADVLVGTGRYHYKVQGNLKSGEVYHWVVLGNSFNDSGVAPAMDDDWYWSAYDTFTVSEPGLLALAAIWVLAGLRRRRAAA